MEEYLINFLKLNWLHAYTLNIDDGIENTATFHPILPYKNANTENTEKKLFKLHGDAKYEIDYNDNNNIVFSSTQYIQSLENERNKSIINQFTQDYKEKNIIFIGCSLNNEQDILYVYDKIKEDISKNNKRITILAHSITIDEELNLENYGINTFILVDDYRKFYQDVYNLYKSIENTSKVDTYPFINPKVVLIDDSIDSLKLNRVFDVDCNIFRKSKYFIDRELLKEIDTSLVLFDAIIIQGRRFSGKTIIAMNIIEKIKNRKIFYFPSIIQVDEQCVREILQKNQDTLFVFDSNSTDNYAYMFLCHSSEFLKAHNNKIIYFVNSQDNNISDFLNGKYLRIDNRFQDEELDSLNNELDKIGVINRRKNNTNLDFLQILSENKYIDFNIMDKIDNSFDKPDYIMLIILAVKEKLYSRVINDLGISNRQVDLLIEKFNGIIEKIQIKNSKERKASDSNFKLVCNSKFCLFKIIESFGKDNIIQSIIYIVKKLQYGKNKRVYVDVIMFDSLNQLFGKTKGSANLIYDIYVELAKELHTSMDYWLQRAKSIYRIYNNDKEKLIESQKYAFKVWYDTNDERVKAKAALTLSVIFCLLLELDKSNDEFKLRAIDFAYRAITSDFYENRSKLNSVIQNEQRRSFRQSLLNICDELYNDDQDNNILMQINIIRKILSQQ